MAPKIWLHLRATLWYLFSASYYFSIFNTAGIMLPVSKCVCARPRVHVCASAPMCVHSVSAQACVHIGACVSDTFLPVPRQASNDRYAPAGGERQLVLFFCSYFLLLRRKWLFDLSGSFEYCPWRVPVWHSYLPRRRWHTPITVTSHSLNECTAPDEKTLLSQNWCANCLKTHPLNPPTLPPERRKKHLFALSISHLVVNSSEFRVNFFNLCCLFSCILNLYS